MFTYFLMGEDTSQRLQRLNLSRSMSSYPGDAPAVETSTTPDALHDAVKSGADRVWPTAAAAESSRRAPMLPRCDHGHSCDVASDVALESIFPNFRRSLAASSKRRRFRHRSATDAAMSYSLQDCSVHDATTTPLKRGALVTRRETALSTRR